MMNLAKKNRRAFTLIELLVVIGIIGVLAAIILPAIRAAKDKARTTQCLNNLRQIGFALQQYTNDFSGFLPHEDDNLVGFRGEDVCWYFLIDPYLETRGLEDAEINEVKLCPSAPKHKVSRPESYRMNSMLMTTAEPFRNIATIFQPSATVGIFDAQTGGKSIKYKGRWTVFSKRHQRGGHILFLDWHVQWYSHQHVRAQAKSNAPSIIWIPRDRDDLLDSRGRS
jgi:prepilin-type N-terminal cleavage/methylation domain-containing protein/prepilin-type processing-associated H-X9-DG protein